MQYILILNKLELLLHLLCFLLGLSHLKQSPIYYRQLELVV
jgi:hypothetical protein